jgi:hypothetical protein
MNALTARANARPRIQNATAHRKSEVAKFVLDHPVADMGGKLDEANDNPWQSFGDDRHRRLERDRSDVRQYCDHRRQGG